MVIGSSLANDNMPLGRCLEVTVIFIGSTIEPLTRASIRSAIATRAIIANLRHVIDGTTGGPAPFAKADRSRFLQVLDEALVRAG